MHELFQLRPAFRGEPPDIDQADNIEILQRRVCQAGRRARSALVGSGSQLDQFIRCQDGLPDAGFIYGFPQNQDVGGLRLADTEIADVVPFQRIAADQPHLSLTDVVLEIADKKRGGGHSVRGGVDHPLIPFGKLSRLVGQMQFHDLAFTLSVRDLQLGVQDQ